jgi:hypothetical protein
MLRAGALRFWISRLWDFHLPREAALLQPHDPTHFERVLRQRVAHPLTLASLAHSPPSALPAGALGGWGTACAQVPSRAPRVAAVHALCPRISASSMKLKSFPPAPVSMGPQGMQFWRQPLALSALFFLHGRHVADLPCRWSGRRWRWHCCPCISLTMMGRRREPAGRKPTPALLLVAFRSGSQRCTPC